MKAYGKVNAWPVLLLVTSLVLVSPPWFTANLLAQSSLEEAPGIIRGETEQGFHYMTGGIGIGEREKMQSWAKDYNLKLSFAEKSGVFLSDVKVLIEKDERQMVRTTSNGPWFYIQLPPGTYNVRATFEGETQQLKNLRLTDGDRLTRIMHWDLEEEFPIYAAMKRSQN
jgi:hypothetical protein